MNILITSVGRRTYLVDYFKEALNGDGLVHVANSSDISPAFLAADRSVVTPIIYDDNYIPFLTDYCKKNEINAIISLFDIDLPVLAQNKDRFTEIGVQLVVSDYNVVDICNDKWKSYKFLSENGFNTPKTYLTILETKESLNNGDIHYPVIIKPRWGIGTMQIFEAEDDVELEVFYEKAKRGVQRSYLKYESNADVDNCILIQEKLIGQEYGLDVINNLRGNYITTVAKMKYAMRAGETDCAVTVDNDVLKSTGKMLGEKLRHIANLDVDVFLVEDVPYVLEMNARFGGGYPFTHLSGIHEPKAIVSWLQGEEAAVEWLEETIGVMGQKDIAMVRLN